MITTVVHILSGDSKRYICGYVMIAINTMFSLSFPVSVDRNWLVIGCHATTIGGMEMDIEIAITDRNYNGIDRPSFLACI